MFELLLGHLVGDYLFQNDWMALNKNKRNSFGWLTCSVHCLLYSLVVCLFTELSVLWFCIVFLSHYFIDHYSLANLWTKMKGNQTLPEYMADTFVGGMAKDQVASSFKSIVYIVTDNTMHLVLMYWLWNLFIK